MSDAGVAKAVLLDEQIPSAPSSESRPSVVRAPLPRGAALSVLVWQEGQDEHDEQDEAERRPHDSSALTTDATRGETR